MMRGSVRCPVALLVALVLLGGCVQPLAHLQNSPASPVRTVDLQPNGSTCDIAVAIEQRHIGHKEFVTFGFGNHTWVVNRWTLAERHEFRGVVTDTPVIVYSLDIPTDRFWMHEYGHLKPDCSIAPAGPPPRNLTRRAG